MSVTACPTSIWVWFAARETETVFAALLVEVLAGTVDVLTAGAVDVLLAGAVDVPGSVELEGAAALEVVAGVFVVAELDVLIELAGATVPPEPPPPHAASETTTMARLIERVTEEGSIRSMVLDNCRVFDCATSSRIPDLKMPTKDRSDPTSDNVTSDNVTSERPVVKKMAIYKPGGFCNHKSR